MYSPHEAARLIEIDESRLRYWAQTGFVNPSGRRAGRPVYTFADLIALRAAKGLTAAGFPVQHVRRCLDRLRETLPGADRPLERLRVWSDGDALVVEADDGSFEALSGQGVLDFRTSALSERAAEVRALPPAGEARRSGYSHFLEGCRLEDAARAQESERAYRLAVEADPTLSSAWTNLGNALCRRGSTDDARRAWERALDVDPDQPEARYNLATLLDEGGDDELAIAEYRRVLRHSPDFADAHFNLALVLERVGGRAQAREHFRRFVEARGDADDAWVRAARERLAAAD